MNLKNETIFVNKAIEFVYNDGGRKEAGYKGSTKDCVCRAISIVLELPYQKVYDDLNEISKTLKTTKRRKKIGHSRTGVFKKAYEKYLLSYGFKWIACSKIGVGCTTHLAKNELPNGRIIVRLSRHLSAVINGVLNDTYDCSRSGNRCVYGYYIKK